MDIDAIFGPCATAERLAARHDWRTLRDMAARRRARRCEFVRLGAPVCIVAHADRLMLNCEIALDLYLERIGGARR